MATSLPMQNRVTPLGDLVADPGRGLVYANRGCLHDGERRICRPYNGKRWIACQLAFRGWRRRPLLTPGRFTELFFLDEATALAAGHRPCALCRRADYQRFCAIWQDLHPGQTGADAVDTQLHGERVDPATRGRRFHLAAIDDLPDATFIVRDGGPWLVLGAFVLSWSASGYVVRRRRPTREQALVITPPSLLAILRSDWSVGSQDHDNERRAMMARAVRFDHYGGIEVLEVVDVERPSPGPGQVLVRVKAAGINPGEASIRKGLLDQRWPATFPSGQGSDLAGVIEETGDGVEAVKAGDEVIGFTDERGSHAELVVVPADHLTARPPNVSWEAAGALFVAGTTAYAAVRAVGAGPDDTIVVSGAAGGVGSLTVQLAKLAGATVIGLASKRNHEWLSTHAVIPVTYGDGVQARIRDAAPEGVDAFVDTSGGGYVELAVALGVQPDRIDTIIDYAGAQKFGAKTEGTAAAASADTLAELATLIDAGQLKVPIAAEFPLEQVRDAFTALEQRHTRGKIVLIP